MTLTVLREGGYGLYGLGLLVGSANGGEMMAGLGGMGGFELDATEAPSALGGYEVCRGRPAALGGVGTFELDAAEALNALVGYGVGRAACRAAWVVCELDG